MNGVSQTKPTPEPQSRRKARSGIELNCTPISASTAHLASVHLGVNASVDHDPLDGSVGDNRQCRGEAWDRSLPFAA